MGLYRCFAALVALLAFGPLAAQAAPAIGQAAPDFTAIGSKGETVHLSDFKGKMVVLEWINDGCPYVGKWYQGGMQALQHDAADKGASWLTIVSSAPGRQGYVDAAQANADTERYHAAPTHVRLDSSGTIARLYGAMTTPHIFVIRPEGTLAYMGGADSIASTQVADIDRAEPYAREAIDAVASGKPVGHAVTRPYGCSVKYGS